MKHLTLRQKIGQLFVLGFGGDSLSTTHPIINDIKGNYLGGVILFDRLIAHGRSNNNIVDKIQLRRLTGSLQEQASEPLLICVDQEGGQVSRFKKERGFPTSPSAAELGQAGDLEGTARCGRQTAEMLKEVGINLNLAPVIDLNIYPDNPIIGKNGRSFSANTSTVVRHARAWIEQHRETGVLSCLKHFPGHGSSRRDSHLGFVDISDTWQESELHPFRQLIEEGLADSIMMGHLYNQKFDSEYPASLSKKTIDTLLHDKLHYSGTIISDDMQMKAITDHYGVADACCRAISAGVDLVIVGNNLEHRPDILPTLIDGVEKGIETGLLSEARIEEAFLKTRTLKTVLYG
jgi:beta-N-acetylhexosaminidase